MSSFSWLDYAESDRRAAMDVIDLFRERDTRDELGIGTVRDTLSDLLFPGTSAIQTRARYFLLIPWIYQRLERSKTESAEAAQKAKREELALVDVLEASDNSQGTIGIRARRSLKRLPSMIYWQGLGRLGIRTFAGSRDQYHRSLNRFYLRTGGTIRNDDGEIAEYGRVRNWDRTLPPAPSGFPKACSLALTRPEAAYLRDRIRHAAPRSLFAHLLDTQTPVSDIDFPWEHPDANLFPSYVVTALQHAQNFSEAMHGAALLYNLMLAELRRDAEVVADHRESLTLWRHSAFDTADRLRSWNLAAFWDTVSSFNARVPSQTRSFINAWLTLVRDERQLSAIDGEKARTLVRERERALKRGLARMDGGRALELWGGASGTRQMDYRWSATARTMITDIHDGLARSNA